MSSNNKSFLDLPIYLHTVFMFIVSWVLPFVLLVSIIAFFVFFVFGQVVPPNFIGVRQNKIFFMGGEEGGFSNTGLKPGLHWKIPGVSEIALLPRDIQIVNFSRSSAFGLTTSQVSQDARNYSKAAYSDLTLDLDVLDVPATNGSKVTTDISLLVRLYDAPFANNTGQVNDANSAKNEPSNEFGNEPGNKPSSELTANRSLKKDQKSATNQVPLPTRTVRDHGGTRDLITAWSIDPGEQLRRFSITVQDALVKNLRTLSTIDFYNPNLREGAVFRAHEAANALANPHGVEVLATLMRRYTYDPSIDEQIFAKNLQETTESLNAALSNLSKAQAASEKLRANWDAKIRDTQVKGESDVNVIRSEGDLYETQQRAAGDLLVSTTKAQIEKLRAEILQTEGANYYVAQQFTPFLKTLQGGIVSSVDPYNVEAWVERLAPK